jgi:hypothetical protein
MIAPAGSPVVVKFNVHVPRTPCYIDAKIAIRNVVTQAVEELVVFKIDVN